MSSIGAFWETSIVPALIDYVRIPAKSPHFDRDWQKSGHIEAAVQLARRWCEAHPLGGMSLEVVRLEGRTLLLFVEVGQSGKASSGTVLLYGHLDKQPEMSGWREDLGPSTPKLENGRLYGRGGADDGYAAFASLTAIRAVREAGVKHVRCVVLIEACEESGSYDLPAYIEHLAPRIGTPSLVICLDSGCGNYDQLWITTSLRGIVNGALTVEVLREGVHSGASGIVPSSFRILRGLLSRLEDERTGEIRPREFHVEIPAGRLAEARAQAEVLGPAVYTEYPLVPGARPGVISRERARRVAARVVAPAANVPYGTGAPEALHERGTTALPDFVCNAGAVLGYLAPQTLHLPERQSRFVAADAGAGQVPHRDHTEDAVAFHDREVTEPALEHGAERLVDGGVLRDGQRIRGHPFGNRVSPGVEVLAEELFSTPASDLSRPQRTFVEQLLDTSRGRLDEVERLLQLLAKKQCIRAGAQGLEIRRSSAALPGQAIGLAGAALRPIPLSVTTRPHVLFVPQIPERRHSSWTTWE